MKRLSPTLIALLIVLTCPSGLVIVAEKLTFYMTEIPGQTMLDENESGMEEELRRDGFTNIVPVSNDQALGRMLIGGRFAAWYGSLNEAAYKFRGIEEVNRRKIRFGKPVSANPVWLAAGLKMPGETVERLRAVMNEMHGDGTVLAILERYGLGETQ